MKFKPLILSVLAGVVSGLSFYHPMLCFLAWFSLIPLFFVIKNNSYKLTFLCSYMAGFAHFLVVVFWVGHVTKLGLTLLLLYLSFYWAIFAVISKKIMSSGRSPVTVSFVWVILEYARANFGALAFGWALFGHSQYKFLYLIQSADMLGVWVISFVIIYCNTLLFNLLDKTDRKILIRQAIFFIATLFLLLIYGVFSFTHAPESHACKGVDEWLSVRGFAPERNPESKEATAVRPKHNSA